MTGSSTTNGRTNGTAHGNVNGALNGNTNGNTNDIAQPTLNGNSTHSRSDSSSSRGHQATTPEPIAICGIGLRLPGGIRTGDAFWDVLYNGEDLRGPIPADRFSIDAFDDSLGEKGSIKTRHGYFLDEDLGILDASLFNMSKLEVEKTDPQQRKVLEVARECLENAGETNWRGKPIGVYVGTFGDDWLLNMTKEAQFTKGYNLSGDFMLANRTSYEFDLQGPRQVVFFTSH
jgi:acyl transferase domain-containing protein